MLPHPSWADGTIDEAIDQLAKQAGQNAILGREKKADSGPGFLQNLGSMWSGLPTAAQAGLVGAGAGGLLGLGRSLTDPEERDNWGRNSLMGAAAGGAIGGGGALALEGLGQAFGGADDNSMSVNVGGREYTLSPEQARQFAADLAPSSTESVLSDTWNTIKEHPWYTALGLGTAGGGALREYNLSRSPVSDAGERWFNRGGEQLRRGAEALTKDNPKSLADPSMRKLQGMLNKMSPNQRQAYLARKGGVEGAPLWRRLLGAYKPQQSAPLVSRALAAGEHPGMQGLARSGARRAGKYAIPAAGLIALIDFLQGKGQQAGAQDALSQLAQ